MSKKLAGLIVAIIAVSALVIIFVLNKPEDKSSPSSSSSQSTTQTSASQEKDTPQSEIKLTREEVAKHSSEGDCWTIINDKVYNITPYVSGHPGGEEILRACGQDGSSLFNSRTTESGEKVGSGTGHSSTAQGILEQYLVGPLPN